MQAPGGIRTTRRHLLEAIARPFGLQLTGEPVVQSNGLCVVHLQTKLTTPQLNKRMNQTKTFVSQARATMEDAEEDVANQALRSYFGTTVISILDYLYMSSLTGQQLAHQYQQDYGNMEIVANQCRGTTRILEDKIGQIKFGLNRSVYEIRDIFSTASGVIPLEIRNPGAPFPGVYDTVYAGPEIPQTKKQEIAQRLSKTVSEAVIVSRTV